MLLAKNGDLKNNQEDIVHSLCDDSFFWSYAEEDINDKSNGWQRKVEHKGKGGYEFI